MRSYKAAKRAELKEPVEFDVTYEVPADLDGAEPVERTDHFVCRGEISSLMLSELAANADVELASADGVALLRGVFSQAFGDQAEYQRFFRVATRYLDDDEVIEIMGDLVEDMVGRPTVRPSVSPATPSASGESSRVDSSLRVEDGVTILPGGFRIAAEPMTETETHEGHEVVQGTVSHSTDLEALASSG